MRHDPIVFVGRRSSQSRFEELRRANATITPDVSPGKCFTGDFDDVLAVSRMHRAGWLVLRRAGGLLQSFFFSLELLRQLLSNGHELARHHVLALKLDLTGQPYGQEGL